MSFSFSVLRPHAGKLTGLAGGLPFGFWGVVGGVLAGAAFDKWQLHAGKLAAAAPATAVPAVGGDVAVAILLLGYARSQRFHQLRDATATLAILQRTFRLDANALRALGKLMRQTEDGTPGGWALPQLRQQLGQPPERRAAWLACLLALAGDALGSVPPGSRVALMEAATALGLPEPDFAELPVENDPYRILAIPRTATLPEIVEAYHRRMRDMHPDRHAGEGDAAWRNRQAARINAAYEQLKGGPGA